MLIISIFFFFNDTATTEIYTLSLHDALPILFTHLPSNILLILVPLMPSLPLATLVLLARFSISQMDVPTRQSYIMAVVGPEERSAAGGISGGPRTICAARGPVFAVSFYARPA